MGEQLVSIIIPTHNEAASIVDCINSFLDQTYKSTEILIVDDASTDGTLDIVKALKSKRVRIISLKENKGEANARTIGVKEAMGKLVVQADADAFYPKSFVEQMTAPFRDNKVGGAVQGTINVIGNPENIFVKFWQYRRDAAFLLKKFKRWPITGATILRKKAVEEVGYYDTSLVGGCDTDLAKKIERAGYKISYVPEAYFNHKDPNNFHKFLKRIWWGAVNTKKYEQKWGIWPKLPEYLLIILRNVLATLIPILLILALFNLVWALAAIVIFIAESILPIIILKIWRTAFLLALKKRDFKFLLAMPFLMWAFARAAGYGKLYTSLLK